MRRSKANKLRGYGGAEGHGGAEGEAVGREPTSAYGYATAAIFLLGIIVRMLYIHNTPYDVRQHDLTGGYEQLSYIMHFTQQWTLPDTNVSQYYHPPLHHMLCALWIRLQRLVNTGIDVGESIENVQYLTALYSSLFMVIANRIYAQLKLHRQFLFMATAVTALHPTLIILSGSINNDMLAILLYASALLWAMKWWDEQSARNTVLLALFIGLGMMAKIGNATLAFVVAPFFLAKLLQSEGRQQRERLFSKFALFGLISLPLGMWHPVRNLVLFGQSFGYVPALTVGGWLDRSAYSLTERVLSFPLGQLLNGPYVNVAADYNLPIYTLKCSLFGEWVYDEGFFRLANALLTVNILLVIMSLVAMVYIAISKRRAKHIMLLVCWAVQALSITSLYIANPFTCSMDFRYIVPTMVCGAGFIGLAAQRLSEERAGLWKALRFMVYPSAAAFTVASVLFMGRV